ncbi:MAG: AAA family ATPase [Candidatus Malihini olakiniferum]
MGAAPGTGKTTLAELIGRYGQAHVERISTVTSGIKEIRKAIERARQNRDAGQRIILFMDEVHRFNKSEQDVFLSILKTAPSPSLVQPLKTSHLSLIRRCYRARVYLLKTLTAEDIELVCYSRR